MIRSIIFIALALLLCGCAHTQNQADTLAMETKRLEDLIQVLQEENQMLIRQLQGEPRDTRFPEVVQRRNEAAKRARDAYSPRSRVRDLQTIIRILERQKKALAEEQDARSDNMIDICTFREDAAGPAITIDSENGLTKP